MEPLTLRTARLLLRPFEERDEEAVTTASNDPDIQRFVPVPYPYERKDAKEYIQTLCAKGWREDTMYNFGIFTHDGALVGSMGLLRLTFLRTAERQAELGFWTARDQRRKGYTVEAGRAVVEWAFTALGVERLEWVAQVENEGSHRVALRLGFVDEGIQRARIVHRGTRRDARIAALLPSDWGRPQTTPYLPSP